MKNRAHTNKGFTLIEVMVVVSIIALLSTVALTSMSSAYSRARDSKKVQMVKQYITALELYRNSNTSYPDTGGTRYCLGETGTATCHGNSKDGSSALNTSLTQYINGTPPSLEKVMASGVDFHGITYAICSPTCTCPGTGCTNGPYQLQWYMEGGNTCGPGTKFISGALNLCVYP